MNHNINGPSREFRWLINPYKHIFLIVYLFYVNLLVREVVGVHVEFDHIFSSPNLLPKSTKQDESMDNMDEFLESPSTSYTPDSSGTAVSQWNTYTVVSDFLLESGGEVEIELKKVEYLSNQRAPVVITLYDKEQWRVYSVLQLKDTPLRKISTLCHFPSWMRDFVNNDINTAESQNATKKSTFQIQIPSRYTLQIQACGDASVRVIGQGTLINLGYDNKLTEHLSADQLGLIPLYKTLLAVYIIYCLLWGTQCIYNRAIIPNIAYLYLVCIQLKIVESGCKWWFCWTFSQYGKFDTFIHIISILCESISRSALLSLMLVAALGWSLTRRALGISELRILTCVVGIYFMITLINTRCKEDKELCQAYIFMEYIVKSLLMLGLLITTNYTSSRLHFLLHYDRWNKYTTLITAMKLRLFYRLRTLILLVIVIPTMLLFLNVIVASGENIWQLGWINELLNEGGLLFVYGYLGTILWPLDGNLLLEVMSVMGTTEATSQPSAHENTIPDIALDEFVNDGLQPNNRPQEVGMANTL